jgi:hypothetical protein
MRDLLKGSSKVSTLLLIYLGQFRYLERALIDIAPIYRTMSCGVIAAWRIEAHVLQSVNFSSRALKKDFWLRMFLPAHSADSHTPHDLPANFANHCSGNKWACGLLKEKSHRVGDLSGELDRAKKQHAGNRHLSALFGRIIGDGQDGRAYRDDIRV